MKILLLIPPVVYKRQPSIGIAYLVSYLRDKGYDVSAWDLNTEVTGINDGDDGFWGQNKNADSFIAEHEELFDNWVERILKYNPDIIGFNVWATSKRQCLFLADKIKEKEPEKFIVFGGPETVLADNLFLCEKSVDVMVRGEGEAAFAEIIAKYEVDRKIEFCEGCFVKRDGKLVDCGPRSEVENLDELSFPDFSDFHLDKYLFKGHIPISFSRGCKWRCSFCTVENCWDKYRSRTAENIFEEINKRLDELTVEQFVVSDSSINQNLGIISDLSDMIIANNLKIKWDGMAQINPDMDFNFLVKMREAGCILLNYGVESGSQAVLNSIGKKYNIKEAQRVIKETHEAGIKVVLNFIVGYPAETEEDFYQTLNFIESVKEYVFNIAPAHPCLVVPYNQLYRHPEKYGIVFNKQDPCQWKTLDEKNNIHEREKRAKIFDNFLESLDIPVRCGDDDREIMEKGRTDKIKNRG